MRKMATIRIIDNILPIDGADMVECAVVDGWKVVVKKGEYHIGEHIVYCEVDCFIPSVVAPFLTQDGRFPKEYLGVQGEHLKTKKIRGVVSQGLILPLSVLGCHPDSFDADGSPDVSDRLGIVKWEPLVNTSLGGIAVGSFPSLVPKTDEERIQNLSKEWDKWQDNSLTYEVTEKLDGSSCTFYLSEDGEFEVCSRNLSLKETPTNSFWIAARRYNIEQKMREIGLFGFAIQGEIVGEGIQGNIYNICGIEFYCYSIWNVSGGRYLSMNERHDLAYELNIYHVPLLHAGYSLENSTIQDILDMAEGKSNLNPKQEREGIVFKCIKNTDLHFKAISNKYLLKQKD